MARTSAGRREVEAEETPGPRVLIPSPEQLARGVRVVKATEQQVRAAPLTVRGLRDAALRAGYQVAITYSLAEYPAGGKRAEAELVETLCVRIYIDAVRIDRAPWAFADWWNRQPDSAYIGMRRIGHTALLDLVRGTRR